jgi:uncharacterized protein
MSSHLPDFVDPWHFVDIGKRISGSFSLETLPRLAPLLMEPEGEAVFELAFSRDERNRARLEGEIRAVLSLQCQRCLGPMSLPVDTKFTLVAVEGIEEAEQLPDSVDPLLMGESKMRLCDLVEDELLLTIPQVPRHQADECSAAESDTPDWNSADAVEEEVEETPNPFAQLANLKTNRDTE